MGCQLQHLEKLKKQNSPVDSCLQSRIKIIWEGKKRLIYIKNKIGGLLKLQDDIATQEVDVPIFKNGDRVKVKSPGEINQILDDWGATQRCTFTPEMYRYCGKNFSVYKNVEYFYDEVKQRMCKCRNIVVLDGIFCTGKRRTFPADCDRNCFLFWHTSWLEKID